jgi:tripartite ATP-independent transporter DctP family solute receptor
MNKMKRILAYTLSIAMMMIAVPIEAKNFKIAVGDAAGGTQHELGKMFVSQLKSKTGGKHTAKLFMNGQLGSEQDTVNDAAMGTLDFSILAINNITPFSPKVGILTLPYMIQSLDDAVKLTQGPIGKYMISQTVKDAGVRIIAWAYSGFRVLTNSKRAVKTLKDLHGLKIRVPKNEIMLGTYNAWGQKAIPMAWSETFTALQQKVVDGQDNPYITVYAMKFYEVQKYVTNIKYLFSIEPLIISEQVFSAQSKKTQKAILAAGKAATKHSHKWLIAQENKIKKELVKKGMVISEPANGEKEWIEKATTIVWPKFYDSVGGKGKINTALKALGRKPIK